MVEFCERVCYSLIQEDQIAKLHLLDNLTNKFGGTQNEQYEFRKNLLCRRLC